MITRWCCSCSCVRRAKAGRARAVYESAWPFLSSPLLLCSYKATWTENVWECESLHLYLVYNKLNKWAQYGVHGCSFVLWCVLQSLLMVIVGFTFPDDQVPTDFIPLWDDWLGETAESFQDWRTGPFYQHLPDQKGSLSRIVYFPAIPACTPQNGPNFCLCRGCPPQKFPDSSTLVLKSASGIFFI